MSGKHAVIFGAGKIARAFISHLLTLSGYHITFVEKSPELVALLRERKQYKVHILGAPEKSIVIKDFEAFTTLQTDAVAEKLSQATVVFISIGGPNLPQIAPLLAAGIRWSVKEGRKDPLNIILCENFFQPGAWLRQLVSEQLAAREMDWLKQNVGFVETMVLRSSIEPTAEMKAEDPLSLKAQDMWEMPADKESFVGPIPEILGLAPKEKFQASLTRKLFTYNAINAVFCYLGYLKGYELLSDAAHDPELIKVAEAAAREASEAICRRFEFDPEDQRQFAAAAIAKYQKREIVDPIERNARDPIRKLARNDRLVGPAMLALEEGGNPVALARAIAAGLRYDPAGDPAALKIQTMIRDAGIDAALRDVCGIHPEGKLADLVKRAYAELK